LDVPNEISWEMGVDEQACSFDEPLSVFVVTEPGIEEVLPSSSSSVSSSSVRRMSSPSCASRD
jgi:hypothetical protein